MPRFVILEHDYPQQHWDFMLEAGDVLRTWKLLDSPVLLLTGTSPTATIRAKSSFDHRLLYLDYEGPISGERGFVKRFDHGSFEWLENTAEKVIVNLKGGKICSIAQLSKLNAQAVDDSAHENWHLDFVSSSVIN